MYLKGILELMRYTTISSIQVEQTHVERQTGHVFLNIKHWAGKSC